MSAVYRMADGSSLAEGLQGCNVCDEAIQTAERIADRRGESVKLDDDDGCWEVFPARAGKRQPARFLDDADVDREP